MFNLFKKNNKAEKKSSCCNIELEEIEIEKDKKDTKKSNETKSDNKTCCGK